MNIGDYTLKVTYKCGSVIKTIEDSDGFLKFDENAGDKRLRITVTAPEKIELLSAEIIYDRYFENNERIFVNGYQSWTTSREYCKTEYQYGLRGFSHIPFVRMFSTAPGDYNFTEYGKSLFHSFTYTYFTADAKNYEFFGSLNERSGYTVFYSDVRENIFAVVKDVEGLKFDGEYELFDIVRLEGSYDDVFDEYFALYPDKKTDRVRHLSGYTSWYNYYSDINEKIIMRDLDNLAAVAGKDANIFQIDDGYQTAVGDWELNTARFPGGMKNIVDAAHGKGLTAGLWLAPFGAQFNSKVVKEHPDWILRKPNGTKVLGGMNWNGFWALNIDLPEVRAHIKAVFDKVFDEWGFDMVKLDFLYAACIEPRNGKTRGQLMFEAMEFIRECCRDKIILGCGVPLAPSWGLVDACRIGCDVEPSFKDKFYVRTTNQEVPSARLAIGNTIFRRHLNGRIFANDPDVFFLRNDGARSVKFTFEQKKLLAKINNMCGDVLFVSDDVGGYDKEYKKILTDTYKKFDGKVLDAAFVGVDKIRINYIENDVKKTLEFDTLTGEYTDTVLK